MKAQQSAAAVLMVRPTSFGFDEQTAESNAFQRRPNLTHKTVLRRANTEFDAAVDTLRSHGIDVTVYDDTPTPPKPNAVFPNNWLSTWPTGHLYLYPMTTESRRIERNDDILRSLANKFQLRETIDLSPSEQRGKFLESTGVMVFDHLTRRVYGCVSERCDPHLFRIHARALGYTPHLFNATDATGTPIYHTNVMMGIQTTTAVVCLEALPTQTERAKLKALLELSGRSVLAISREQMNNFCGNVLELHNTRGEKFVALSQSAYDHFTPEQRRILGRDKTLLPLAIPTIEALGGGSVRCMLAEIFLPPTTPDTGTTHSAHHAPLLSAS